MLPAMRHLLRFVDADSKFANHGFIRKVLSSSHHYACTHIPPRRRDQHLSFTKTKGKGVRILFLSSSSIFDD